MLVKFVMYGKRMEFFFWWLLLLLISLKLFVEFSLTQFSGIHDQYHTKAND